MNIRPAHPSRPTPRALGLVTACLLAALCAAPTLAAGSLTRVEDFDAGKARAEAELLADKAACDKLAGNPRDICRERARGKELVAKAELDLAHTGTRKAQDQATTVRLDTAYDLARTQCNDKAGSAKTICTKEAQAVRAKGETDLKLSQRVTDARRDAAEDRREADHKLAAEKCHAMAADARASCLATAKAKAGKT